jgi:hypothetical protein
VSRSTSDSPRRSSSTASRRSHRHRFDVDPARPAWRAWVSFDGIVEALLYALLTFTPLAFGGADPWSQEVFVLLIAAAAVVVAVKHVVAAWTGRGRGYRWSWAYPIMLLFLALCAAQAVPLPAAVVSAVSPATVRVKAELLADLPNVAATLRHVTVSFYPHATISQTALVAAVAVLFAVVLDVFRSAARIRRLLTVVVGVGLVVAGMAAYQNLTGSTLIYGVQPAAHRNAGPFMNYSHFSQFMNLSVGAALALLLDRVVELSEFYRTPGEVWRGLREPRNAVVWACGLLCVAGPITVMLSSSRMGMISLFAAAVVSGVMLFWRGRSSAASGGGDDGRAWLLVGLALTVFAVLLGVGADAVSRRLATVQHVEVAGGGRLEMLRDMVVEFKQFPLLGTGLGTHETVFGMYDSRNVPTLADHAENEYFQLMEETGVAGVALAAGFLALVIGNYWRATRRPVDPIDFTAFGLGFGLVAILAHSGTDFGQHMPADAALTATFAALLASLARRSGRGVTAEDDPTGPADPVAVLPVPRRPGPLLGAIALTAVSVTAGVAGGLWTDRARAAASLSALAIARADELQAHGWQGTDAAYADLLAPADAAVRLEPGNVEYRHDRDGYRWHQTARSFNTINVGRTETLSPAATAVARTLVDDLTAARPLCPTYGPSLCDIGQFNRDALGQRDLGSRQIQLSYRLAPYNLTVCLIAGLDALDARQWDRAEAILGRYTAMGGSPQNYVDQCLYVGWVRIPFNILAHDWQGMQYLASRIPSPDARWDVWRARCQNAAADLLAVEAAKPDAPADIVASQAANERDQGRTADAIALYRRALQQDYGNFDWRLALARCLAADHPAEAARELSVCLRLRPNQPDAAALLADCDARSATRPTTAP